MGNFYLCVLFIFLSKELVENLSSIFEYNKNCLVEKLLMDNINKVLENETNSDKVGAVNERLEELKEQMMNLVRLDVRKKEDKINEFDVNGRAENKLFKT